MTSPSKGLVPTAAAFAIWGLFPLYFQPLHRVSSLQVVAHRVVWACVFVLVWIAVRGELPAFRAAFADRGILWRLTVTAMLISLNWLVYVWGVLNGRVLETSLGYFIGPLVNVVLGVVLLAEKLTPAQWTAVALAAAGVGYLTVNRRPAVDRADACILVCGLRLDPQGRESRNAVGASDRNGGARSLAAGYLLRCGVAGTGELGHAGPAIDALLIGSGPLTAFALFLYAYGARRLPYSTVGLLQYITPTLQFACGVFAFHEPFKRTRAIGFTLIWAALLIYAGEGFRISRRQQRVRSRSPRHDLRDPAP